MSDTEKDPNCLKCIYFKVTWQENFPRMCTVFGIKTRNLPSVEVHRASGRICPSFIQKDNVQ